jgi:hypothetical protein
METKILLQAINYAPEKVAEFIINLYTESSSECKKQFDAKFESYFTELPDQDRFTEKDIYDKGYEQKTD